VTVTDRLRLAVFIDFDNIEIGVKQTLNASFDAGLVLEALKERGDVVSKTAYSDWQRAGGHSRTLNQHAIKMVQRNLTPGGDKNGADINLALDALEMAFTHPHINAFVIVGGDSDFISLVEKLKQYDKKVFVVGGRQFTSGIMQRNCHEFIAYENLIGAPAAAHANTGGRRHSGRSGGGVERTPIEQAIPLVNRALAVLTEREVSPQLGLLKSTLLQLDSTFSERSFGAGSFRDFVEKLAAAGVLRAYQGKGGWLVAPVDGVVATEAAPEENGDATNGEAARAVPVAGPVPVQIAPQAVATLGSQADGLLEFRKLLGSAAIRRWPMYLRNVKQIFKQATPVFDERAYGYGSLVDLLRAAQKEGLVRLDRDRQGVVRVFRGSSAVEPVAMVPVSAEATAPMPIPEAEPQPAAAIASDPDLSVGPGNTVEGSHSHSTNIAKPRRPRAATPRERPAAAQRRPRKKVAQ